MSRFTQALIIQDSGDGKLWRVAKAFRFYIGHENSDEYSLVQKCFETDLASIPRAAQLFIPKLGKFNQAAVLHDHDYRAGYYTRLITSIPTPVKLTRKKADQILLEAMGVLGVRRWRKYAIYYGVRVGGRSAWNKCRQNDIEDYPMDCL